MVSSVSAERTHKLTTADADPLLIKLILRVTPDTTSFNEGDMSIVLERDVGVNVLVTTSRIPRSSGGVCHGSARGKAVVPLKACT